MVAVEAPLDPSRGRLAMRSGFTTSPVRHRSSSVAPRLPPFVSYSVGGGRLALPWTQGVRLVDLSTGKASVIDPDIGALSTLGLSPTAGPS